MSTYISLGHLPSSACGTAELISKLDRTFDCLNSSSLKGAKVFRRAITSDSPHIKFLEEMLQLIPTIKVINKESKKDVTGTLKCLNALQVTISGIIQLWNNLHEASLFFLCTRRLNQDPLENFFGAIRQQGGNSENPTPIQFCRAYRKLFYKTLLQQSSGNCTEDLDDILVSPKAGSNRKATSESISDVEPFVMEESDFRELNIADNPVGGNAITYVAGYLITKCLKKHECNTCASSLINPTLDSSDKLFCYFKGYESPTKTYGGLTVPNDAFIEYVTQIENKMVNGFSEVMCNKGVSKALTRQLPLFVVQRCPEFPSKYLLMLFVRMRIYYILKFGNRELSSGKKKNRKYFKVQHL